jgi:hypothetical protein
VGEKDLAHSAFAKLGENPVVANGRADHAATFGWMLRHLALQHAMTMAPLTDTPRGASFSDQRRRDVAVGGVGVAGPARFIAMGVLCPCYFFKVASQMSPSRCSRAK